MVFNQLYPPQTESVEELRKWCVSLIDNLRVMFNNLDEQNVRKAASIVAENVESGTLKEMVIQTGGFYLDSDGNIVVNNNCKLICGSASVPIVTVIYNNLEEE